MNEPRKENKNHRIILLTVSAAALIILIAFLVLIAPPENTGVKSALEKSSGFDIAEESEELEEPDTVFDDKAYKAVEEKTEYETTTQEETEEIQTEASLRHTLNMDCLHQYPELPTGCESVSLTNVLNYYGYKLDKCYIVDNYLLYRRWDYEVGFSGSPYSEAGGAIYPKGIVDTANNFFKDNNSTLCAYEISKTGFSDLIEYIRNDVPVMIWITDTFNYPEFSGAVFSFGEYAYSDYWGEHCVALTGFDLEEKTAEIANPLAGNQRVSMSWLNELYDACGQLAVVIE